MESYCSIALQMSPDLRNVNADTGDTDSALRNLGLDVKPKKNDKINSSVFESLF